MNFPFYIAKRYLFSKKSHNVINVISLISVAGIAVGTMALIIVLSVFNGFEGLVISLFSSFNSDMQITVKDGKTFFLTEDVQKKIKSIPGVVFYNEVVEENALLKCKEKQYIATIKGVSNGYEKMNMLDTMLLDGSFMLKQGGRNNAVFAQGVAYKLGITSAVFNDPMNALVNPPVSVYVPKRSKTVILDPTGAFNEDIIFPSGVFSIHQDVDMKYVIIPLSLARELLDYTNEVTAIELGLSKNADNGRIQKEIQKIIGNKFYVKNKYQQQEFLYKVMKSEKWAVFLILAFILLIATFNVIGSLTMLILEKKEDIKFLHWMGGNIKTIKRIFLAEGLMITLFGAFAGLLLGGVISYIQQRFGIIPMPGGESFIVDAYPVKIKILDFVFVIITVFLIGLLAAWYPVRQISRKYLT